MEGTKRITFITEYDNALTHERKHYRVSPAPQPSFWYNFPVKRSAHMPEINKSSGRS
jgi:hypothetical protein